MKLSEAIKIWESKDQYVKDLQAARRACNVAGVDEAEQAVLMALVSRLKLLTGKPIVIGV